MAQSLLILSNCHQPYRSQLPFHMTILVIFHLCTFLSIGVDGGAERSCGGALKQPSACIGTLSAMLSW